MRKVEPPSQLNISLAQMVSAVPSNGGVDVNWRHVEKLCEEAVEQQAHIIVLPENFLTFGSKERASIPVQQSWISKLSQLSREQKLWIVAGTLPLQLTNDIGSPLAFAAEIKPYATSLVFNDAGNIVGEYRKVHLFDALVEDTKGQYRESDDYSAGDTPVVVATPWGVMGLGVCYDLRFPEYFQALRDLGADFIALPSAFTYITGKAHWQVLCRARAIENQCFMLACNQGGQHSPSRKTWGESMIIDPWGEILASKMSGEGLVSAGIDLKHARDLRLKMPVIEHRKLR